MTSSYRSALYTGRVLHHRFSPKTHRLVYRVFSLLLDLDELPALDRDLRFFSWNCRNLISFHNADHGPADGGDLKSYAHGLCLEAGAETGLGRVELLCYPRLWGYAFNPLSVYFCYDRDDRVAAMIYEVRNTFGQRHSYVLPRNGDSGVMRHRCEKQFYVSPFMGMEAEYQFRVAEPGEKMNLAIRQSTGGTPMMNAAFLGDRQPLTADTLVAAVARNPMMTFKVMAGIHWEAVKLWRKGLSFHKRPAPPARPFTIVKPMLRHQEK